MSTRIKTDGRVSFPLLTCIALSFQITANANDFDPWTQTARYELEQRIDLTQWANAEADSVRVWIPIPATNQHQRLISKTIDSP